MYKNLLVLFCMGNCFANDPSVAAARRLALLQEPVEHREIQWNADIKEDVPLYNFQNRDFRGINLNCFNLKLANLENANLTGVSLKNAAISENTNLKGAIMTRVNFADMYIQGKKYSYEVAKFFLKSHGAVVD